MTERPEPHVEIRRRIMLRLSTDEWMEKHFGIVAHAGDVADAVLDLFEEVGVEEFGYGDGVRWPGPVLGAPTATCLVLKTAPEVKP